MNIKQSLILLFAVILLAGCAEKNPYIRNVEQISVQCEIEPFHTDIFDLAQNPSDEKLTVVKQQYGTFFDSYVTDLQRSMIPSETDTSQIAILQRFFSDEWIQALSAISDSSFNANKSLILNDIHSALQYHKYYFPNAELPRLYSFVAGVNYSMAIDSAVVGIGIDKYLGEHCDFYKSLNMESYIRKNMYIQKLPADLMRAFAESEFPQPFTENYLLANMIQAGRYQYYVKCMLPTTPDSVLWGFSAQQLDFCKKSEGEFWQYFVSTQNLLFSNDRMVQKRFLDDGPFTTVFTRESPARVGQWIGFKIVESFMQNNPSVSLADLFAISSSKEIMSKAKYNPK